MSAPLPSISVCIPVRNGARDLDHTLRHLLVHSDYPSDRFEVILADHTSEDDTSQVIAAWSGRHSNVRRIQVPFLSPCRAVVRNATIQASAAELLVFIDHDILTPPGFLRAHVTAHRLYGNALVAGPVLGTRFNASGVGELYLDQTLPIDMKSLLCKQPWLADPRLQAIDPQTPHTDLTERNAPFRWFWGGNLSAARLDAVASGGFHEGYEGWGLEDDDFAQRFLGMEKRLVFAREAAALHIPRRSDGFGKLAQWRRNLRLFLQQNPTREVECYGIYGPGLVDQGTQHLNEQARILGLVEIDALISWAARALPRRTGRRLSAFIPDPLVAQRLQLTDALTPFCRQRTPVKVADGITFWPLLGAMLPFTDLEFDEAIVLVDSAMWLDPSLLRLLLCEVARCAKSTAFCASASAKSQAGGLPYRAFRDAAALIRFEQVHWLEEAATAARLHPTDAH